MNIKTLFAGGLIGLATFACQDDTTTIDECETPSFDAGNSFADSGQDTGLNYGDASQDAGLDTTDTSLIDVEVADVTDTIQERCTLVTLAHDNRIFDITNNGKVIETPEPPTTFDVSPTVEVCPSAATNLSVYNRGYSQAGTITINTGTTDGYTDQVQIEVQRFEDSTILSTHCVTEGTAFELTTRGGYLTIETAEGCSN